MEPYTFQPNIHYQNSMSPPNAPKLSPRFSPQRRLSDFDGLEESVHERLYRQGHLAQVRIHKNRRFFCVFVQQKERGQLENLRWENFDEDIFYSTTNQKRFSPRISYHPSLKNRTKSQKCYLKETFSTLCKQYGTQKNKEKKTPNFSIFSAWIFVFGSHIAAKWFI